MNQEELKIIISANADKLRQEFSKVQNDIKKQADGIGRVFNNIFSSSGKNANTSKKMSDGINSAANSAKDLNKAIEDTTAALDNVNARIEQQKNKLAQLKESYRNAFNEAKKNALEEKILKTEANIIKLTTQSDKLGFKLADLDDKMANLGRNTDNTNTRLNNSNSAANKASKGMKNLSNSVKKASNSVKNNGNVILMTTKRILMWRLAIPAIIKRIKAMNEGLLNNLMTNQQFSNSLAQIKSNLMIAFTPIYEAILPAINTLMHALSVASQYFASFISAIFGKTYSQSVQATQGLIDAKNAMGVYGDSAKAAGEKVKDLGEDTKDALGLASFDEINSLNSNKDSSGGGSGGAGGGGGANVPQLVTPALETSNIDAAMKGLVERIKKLLAELLSPLKTAWDNYGDWFLSKWDYFKDAFKYNTDQLSKFLVSVWNNGGKEFVQHLGEIGIVVGGTALKIGGDILVALGNLWKHLDPDNNPYTRKFIKVMNDLAIAVRDFIMSAGNWFGKFLSLGGQAFINVMGDIVMLVGTILAKVMRDAINFVTKFMNSWAGSALIGAVALTLNIVAGAIKAVLVIIEKCHVVLEAFLVLWGAWKFSKVISGIGDTTTKLGGFIAKLTGLGSSLADNIIEFGKWVATIGGKAFNAIKNFATYIGGTVIRNLKNFGREAKNPITTIKNLTEAIKLNVKAFIDLVKQLILSSVEWAKNTAKMIAQKAAFVATNASMIASTVAIKAAAAAQWLLNVALNACPIVAIITAIGLLVVAVKKIGDKFGWWEAISKALSGVLEWVGEKVGWLWDKVKSFFGWDEEPAANANFDSVGEHAEEAAKTTDDAFGTASSNVNKYLDSIHFNATRLAEEVDEATKAATEKFGMLSQSAQEYLDAIVKNDTERLAQMGENQSAYNEEVKAMYADLTEAEKNEFMKKYGIIKGINDDMLNYEGLTYDERVARHAAYLSTIEKDDSLSYQEKKTKMDKANADFQSSINSEVTKYKESIANKKKALDDLLATHGNTTEEGKKYEKDLRDAIEADKKHIENITKSSYDTQVTTSKSATEEIKKTNKESVKAQEDSYKDLEKTSKKAMDDINKSLKDSKKNIKDFVKESKELSKDLKKAFDGIGDKISGEFEKAKKSMNNSFNQIKTLTSNVTKNLSDSWVSSLAKVANVVKSKLDAIKNIYQSFSSNINNITTNLVNSVSTKISKLNDSYVRSFNNIKNNIDRVMDSSYNKVNNSLNNIRSLFNNFNATLRVKIPHFYMYGRFDAETGQVPKVGVNYFARGGVVDRATLGVFGEAGREAIVPLEHNTEWMDTLKGIMDSAFSEAMQGNSSNINTVNDQPLNLTIQVGTTTLGKVAIDSINKVQRQAGKTLIRI